jgi:hypothetical protein
MTARVTLASPFAAAPLASGVPTVTEPDVETGGLHDGNASGGPWVRFGAVHAAKAGTMETRIGVAPFGRGCVAEATDAMIINAAAPSAAANTAAKRLLRISLPSAPPQKARVATTSGP